MVEKDLSYFIQLRTKKQLELENARKRARSLNKEIKHLNVVIADNLKDMVLTGSKEQIDDQNYGWVYKAEAEDSQLNK